MKVIHFANIRFQGLTKEILLKEENTLKIILTCNADVIVKLNENSGFIKLVNDNCYYATLDGQIPYFLAKLKNPSVYFEKISGSDFIYDICEFAREYKKRVFLLGGNDNSNIMSVELLKNSYGIEIEGYSPPFSPYPFDRKLNDAILNKIINFKPHFLCVGFGALKQEFWIHDNRLELHDIGVKWAINVGGSFEFISGIKKRAPKLIRQAGLEGVYRFLIEPKWYRLKRLLISFKMFKYL